MVCSFNIEGRDPAEVGTFLDVDHHIMTRTGLECAPLVHKHIGTFPKGTVRFSVGPFNTEAHIDQAIQAVTEIVSQRKRAPKIDRALCGRGNPPRSGAPAF